MQLSQGDIVWALFPDPAGRNAKMRPAVVVTPSPEIASRLTVHVVAVTSTLTDPMPQTHVILPWHRSKHPVSGLTKRCVAVCDWIEEIERSNVKEVGGRCPRSVLEQILDRIP